MTGLTASKPARDERAYVTLVTNRDYIRGAEALIRSIDLTGSPADRVVLYTGAVDFTDLAGLASLGARLIQTELLPTSDAFNTAHAKRALHGAAPFTKGEKPSFHTPLDNFVKLRLWQLVEYRAIVFIDADAIVLQNCDRLFEYPEFSAAPNVYEGLADFRRLNSGVFTAKPSQQTFDAMLARLDTPGVFWRRTDQTFLETFFPAWHGLPVYDNMLQYVWFNLPVLWDWSQIRILHYQYEKPWQDPHPKAQVLAPLIDLWHRIAAGQDLPPLDSLPRP